MFLGPIELHKPWNTKGIDGVSKFLRKLWRLFFNEAGEFEVSDAEPTKAEYKALHKCIQKVEDEFDRFVFNTSVSHFMICVNELTELNCNKRDILEQLTVLVSCHAPHISEELWNRLGNDKSVTTATFPEFKSAYLVENEHTYPVSFNGKVRFKLTLPADASKEDVESAVMSNEQATKWLDGKQPKKVIVVPKRIVNIVL
jgi:leucyl-tRNA synthetase